MERRNAWRALVLKQEASMAEQKGQKRTRDDNGPINHQDGKHHDARESFPTQRRPHQVPPRETLLQGRRLPYPPPSTSIPAGPTTLPMAMAFGSTYLKRLSVRFGKNDLCARILAWNWRVNTTFTGIGCAEFAVSSLAGHCAEFVMKNGSLTQRVQMGTTTNVTFGFGCDFSASCQRVLASTFGPGRCVFSDITQWIDSDNRFRSTAPCMTHGNLCRLPVDRASSSEIDISGPPCVMFSNMGKRDRCDDPRYAVHEIYMKHRKDPWAIVRPHNPSLLYGVVHGANLWCVCCACIVSICVCTVRQQPRARPGKSPSSSSRT
jgi:hypothetical protein